MSVANIANVQITLDGVQPAPGGFGIAAALHTFTAPQRTAIGVDEYLLVTPDNWEQSLLDIGVTTSEPIYAAVGVFFSQVLKPKSLYLISAADFVAQVNTIQVVTSPDGSYTVVVDGIQVSFPASGNTVTEVRDGLVGLINGLPAMAALVTAAPVSTDQITLTAVTAGANFAASVVSPASDMTIAVTTANEGYVDDLIAFSQKVANYWFILETARNTARNMPAAVWAQSQKKAAFFLEAAATAQDPGDATDLASLAGALGHNRTAPFYDPTATNWPDFAAVGKQAPKTPGSTTWHMQALVGAPGFVPSNRQALEDKRYSWNELFAGVSGQPSALQNGQVASGQFIDTIRARDNFDQDLTESLFFLFLNSEKVPYTEDGVDLIETVIREVVKRWERNGFLVYSSLVITRVPVADISSSVRGTRCFDGISFTVRAQGAIHKIDPLRGNISF